MFLKVLAQPNHLAFFALVGLSLETRIHPLRPFVSFPLDVCWLESCVLDLKSFASVLFLLFFFLEKKLNQIQIKSILLLGLIVLLSQGFGNRTALFSENKIWFHTFFYLILVFKYWYYRVFATFSGLGCGGSSLSREAQTSLFPSTSSTLWEIDGKSTQVFQGQYVLGLPSFSI